MSARVVKGKFNNYSNGEIDHRGAHRKHFMTVGGERIESVAWSEYLHNFIQPAINKDVRMVLVPSEGYLWVRAIEVDGKIEREKRFSVGPSGSGWACFFIFPIVFSFLVGVLFGVPAILIGLGVGFVVGFFIYAYIAEAHTKKIFSLLN